MEYTNSYNRGCCLFEDVCDMSFSKDGKVICLTSADGNIDGELSLLAQNGHYHLYGKYILVRKCGNDWPILMQLTPDEYNHKPVLATIFTPNVYDNSVPEGRIIFARQELINIQNNSTANLYWDTVSLRHSVALLTIVILCDVHRPAD